MTHTRTALTVLIAILLATIATPAQAHTTATTGESPAHVAQAEPGKMFLTLIIVYPGTTTTAPEPTATDQTPPATITPELTTPEPVQECPGHYSTPGPHPCPQTNRTGIDHAHSDPTPATPSPQPEPRRGNDS